MNTVIVDSGTQNQETAMTQFLQSLVKGHSDHAVNNRRIRQQPPSILRMMTMATFVLLLTPQAAWTQPGGSMSHIPVL